MRFTKLLLFEVSLRIPERDPINDPPNFKCVVVDSVQYTTFFIVS